VVAAQVQRQGPQQQLLAQLLALQVQLRLLLAQTAL
jgi:hypothetical protein